MVNFIYTGICVFALSLITVRCSLYMEKLLKPHELNNFLMIVEKKNCII